MHGHKRAEYKARLLDPKVAAGLQHKANQWFKLNDQVLAMPPSLSAATTMTNLELLSNMLQVNPDPLYLWQRRRDLLRSLFQNESDKDQSDKSNSATTFDQYISEELTLTRKCLERNPKAYGAWFHRKWSVMESIQRKVSSTPTATPATGGSPSLSLLQHELQLTEQFLNLDERNFHCWSYRRFVVGCMCGNTSGEIILMDGTVLFGPQVGHACVKQEQIQNDGTEGTISSTTDSTADAVPTAPAVSLTTPQIQSLLNSEFDFTTRKIQQNFSNGSAFHYRSKLLPYVRSCTADHSVSLSDELELAHNAMFTEPDDQTAWWYYDFLLTEYASPRDSIGSDADPGDGRALTEQIDLEQEKEMLEELLEAEGGQSKWALLALYHVFSYMDGDDNNDERESRRREVLETLQVLDPDRRVRYQDMMKKKTKKISVT